MCAIFGFVGSREISIDENIMPHRGPDSWGAKVVELAGKVVTLFHSRLSIIGHGEQGNQPYSKDGKNFLIYNGEIYNYREIRKLLEDEGISFVSDTDTEVLYEAMRHWPVSRVLDELNGMFAYAYLARTDGVLTLVRDPLGIKPCYYASQGGGFMFSSETKSFFELGLLTPMIRRSLIPEYLANGWVYEPDTLFEDVYKLSAGHYMTLDIRTQEMAIHRYWSVDDAPAGAMPDLASVARSQTLADVKVGNYLSGGVDSSIIATALRDHPDMLHLNLDFFDSESVRVNYLEEHYGLNVQRFKPTGRHAELFRKLIYHLDEPVADPAIIPAYFLAERSRDLGRIVMLSGMGGDEIDAGYNRHRIIERMGALKWVRWLPMIAVKVFRGKRRRDAERLLSFFKKPTPDNYYSLTSYFTEQEISAVTRQVDWKVPYGRKLARLLQGQRGKRSFFFLDIIGFLTSHNLLYMDKASMAASVEVRVPLLDKNVVASYFQDIEKQSSGKKRLRGFLRKLVGSGYFEVQKQGFRYPVRNELMEKADWEEIIGFFHDSELLDSSVVRTYVDCYKSDPARMEMKLWAVYTLYLWMKVFDVQSSEVRSC